YIIMAPSSHMGDAEPIPLTEKNLAYVSAEFRSTAEKRNRDPFIAAGMVDKGLDVPDFPPGKLVNLTASQAMEIDYADATLATTDQVLEFMDWSGADIVSIEPDHKIRLAQFLTRSGVVSALLTIGMLAMVIELFTQGFGLAGFVGILAFGLYFGGGFLAGNTDLWAILVFIIGIILMLIEAVIPGFGIFGISGIVAFIVAIIFAAPTPMQGFTSLGIALILTIVATPILYKLLGGSKVFRRFVLSVSETVDEGYVGTSQYADLLGKAGKAITALRPSGTATIEGSRYDVITDGDFVSKDSDIEVVQIEGNRIIVDKKSE
ncbi:MAG TPA: NfeD family protein, partial [Bacillota bacterium]|nr:NfeD family protein [Bacillota bacterium]